MEMLRRITKGDFGWRVNGVKYSIQVKVGSFYETKKVQGRIGIRPIVKGFL